MSLLKPMIVVIEDDAKMRRLLRQALREGGFDVREAESGRAGLLAAATRKPDLIMLDLGLPDVDGTEILRQVRQWWEARPVLVLSGRVAESDKVAALEAGADDFIPKPFGLPELVARVRAALRRSARRAHPDDAAPFRAHGIEVDLVRRSVSRSGRAVDLTPNEFRILSVLVGNAGLPVPIERLALELWGPGAPEHNRSYLRSYVATLRRKLERDPARPVLILTEGGIGYRLMPEPDDAAPPADINAAATDIDTRSPAH